MSDSDRHSRRIFSGRGRQPVRRTALAFFSLWLCLFGFSGAAAAAPTVKYVDQGVTGSAFMPLGVFYFNAGATATVTLTVPAPGGSPQGACADAVKIEKIDGGADFLIDDEDAGFSSSAVTGNATTGWYKYNSWNTANEVENDDFYYSYLAGATATWAQTIAAAGYYRVSARWLRHSAFASPAETTSTLGVPYTISGFDSENVTRTVTLDNPGDGSGSVTVTANAGSGTHVGNTYTIAAGASVALTVLDGDAITFGAAAPAADSLLNTGASDFSASAATGPITVNADTTLTARFDRKWTISFATDGHGTLTGTTSQEGIPPSDGFTAVTAKANAGYYFDHWDMVKNGVDQGDNLQKTFDAGQPDGPDNWVITANFKAYTVAITAVATTPVTEADTMVTFTVELERDNAWGNTIDTGSITVDYATGGGTAAAGSDYTAASGTLTFNQTAPNNTLSRDISVTIKDDDLYEPDETFAFTLSNFKAAGVAAAGTITTASETATIEDDGDKFTIRIYDATKTEADTTVQFKVELDQYVAGGVTIAWATGDGTAVAPGDYTSGSGNLIFLSNENSRNITVAIKDDDLYEAAETFKVTLTNPDETKAEFYDPGAGPDAVGECTISDDGDKYGVSIQTSKSVTEGTDDKAVVTVTLDQEVPGGASVAFALTPGTAVLTGDYTADTISPLTFAADETTQDISVNIVDDSAVENNEQFTVTVSSVDANAEVDNTAKTATVTITDDDTYGISIDGPSATEAAGGSMTFTATIDQMVLAGADDVTVSWATADDGSGVTKAVAGADYTAASGTVTFAAGDADLTQTFTVDLLDDDRVENDETFLVNLTNPTNLGALTDGQGTGTIEEDAADKYGVSIDDITVDEDVGNAEFTVTVDQAVVADRGPLVVTYSTANGTSANPATAGADFTGATNATISIAAGDSSGTISVPVADDTTWETAEDFFVNLTSAAPRGNITDAQGKAVINADNSDKYLLSVADINVDEDAGNAVFTITVTKTVPYDQDVTFSWATSDGTAEAGTDYTAASGTDVTISAGSGTFSLSVPIIDDADVETPETFTVTLTSPSANATIVDGSATCTIARDERYKVYIDDINVDEGAGPAVFKVWVVPDVVAGDSVPVNFATADLSAAAPGDYTSISGTATIAALASETTVSVPITNYANPNADPESTEQFRVNLTIVDATQAELGDGQGNCTITDNDHTVTFQVAGQVGGRICAGDCDETSIVTQTANHGTALVDTVEARIDAGNGYYFKFWEKTGSGDVASLDTTVVTVTNVLEDMTLAAHFSNLYTVLFSAGINGTLDGEITQVVAYGSATTAVTAIEDVGYLFDGWGNDVPGGSEDTNPLVINPVTGDMVISASFVGKTADANNIPGCATAASADYSGGFDIGDFIERPNIDTNGDGHLILNTGAGAIDPDSIVIPFEQEVTVNFVAEWAGYKSTFGWLLYEDVVDSHGNFVGWNNISEEYRRTHTIFRKIVDDGGGTSDGVFDSLYGAGSFPTGSETALATYDDGSGNLFVTDGDGSVTPKDMKKSLGLFAEGSELVFWVAANRDYNTSESDQVFFSKKDWNTDTYSTSTPSCAGNNFDRIFHLGENAAYRDGTCYGTGWLDTFIINRIDSVFGVSLTGTSSFGIQKNKQFRHVMVGAPPDDPNQWILGFEDLKGGGDSDYNDMTFRIERRTGGIAELAPAAAITPKHADGSEDYNSFYTAVNLEIYDHMPCSGLTQITYWVSINGGADGTWVEVTDWDEVRESNINKAQLDLVENWIPGTPAYTYRFVRIDFAAMDMVGRELVWKAMLESRDETCVPAILGANATGTVATNGSFSRATPVVQTNVIYSGSYETPAGNWVDKENRGHLEATRLYDPVDPSQTAELALWDAGQVLTARDFSADPRTIYFPQISLTSVSGQALTLAKSPCSTAITTVEGIDKTISVTTAGNTSTIETTIATGSYGPIVAVNNGIETSKAIVATDTKVTTTTTILAGTQVLDDGLYTTTTTVTGPISGDMTIQQVVVVNATAATDSDTTWTESQVTTVEVANPSVTTQDKNLGDGCTRTFAGILPLPTNGRISATTLKITDGRETFIDEHTQDLSGSFGGTGRINRANGSFSVTFDQAPAKGVPITASFSYYTDQPNLVAFNNANVTSAMLGLDNTYIQGNPSRFKYDFDGDGKFNNVASDGTGTVDDTDGDWLVQWVRGYKDPATSTKKEWVLGPVDHSAPALMTPPGTPQWYFGTAIPNDFRDTYAEWKALHQDRRAVLFVGSRDGMLHAFDAGNFQWGDSSVTSEEENRGYFQWELVSNPVIDGDDNIVSPEGAIYAPPHTVIDANGAVVNKASSPDTSAGEYTANTDTVIAPNYGTGRELWAFIPANLVPRLKNNYLKAEDRAYVDASPALSNVFLDTDADQDAEPDTWKTVVLSAQGNGGDTVVCIDVTNPDSPQFMWEFSDPDLFRSRSSPAIAQIGVTNFNGEVRWTAFFVSGKMDDATQYPSIYMIDIAAGTLIQRVFLDTDIDITVGGVTTEDAGRGGIPSGQPAAIDSDGNGYLDRIYIGTDKGFLYKVNIPDEDPDPNEELDSITVCILNQDFVADDMADPNTVPAAQWWHPIYASPTVLVDNQMVNDAISYNIKVFFGTSDNPYFDEGTDTGTTTFHFFAYLDKGKKAECGTGELDWFYTLPQGHRISASAFAAAGQIYFGTTTAEVEDPCAGSSDDNAGRIYVLNLDTGESLVSDPTDGAEGLKVGNVRTSPLVDDEHLYFKTASGLQSLGKGEYNNAITQGTLSDPAIRVWREVWAR